MKSAASVSWRRPRGPADAGAAISARATMPGGSVQAVRAVARPAQGSQEREENAFPFWCLMFFTFVLFVAPQWFFPVLQPLQLARVAAVLSLVTHVFYRLSRGRPVTVNVPEVRLVLVFAALAILSIPFSRWPGGSVEVLTDELSKSLVLFLLVANTVRTLPRIKLLIGSLALWGTVISVTAVRNFSAGNLAMQGRISGYSSPVAANPNDLALTLDLIFALVLGLYSATVKPRRRLLLLGALGVLAAGVIVSFSRQGFLGLSVILVAFLAKRARARGIASVAPALGLIALAVLLAPAGYSERVYSIFDSSADATGSASSRSATMLLALDIMLQHPLLGAGLGQDVLALVERGGGWSETHNVFLQVGVDLGLPGLLVYALFIGQVLRGLRRSQNQLRGLPQAQALRSLGNGIEMAVLAFVVASFFAPVPYHFYFYYLAGFAVAYQQMAQRALLQHRALGPAPAASTGRRQMAKRFLPQLERAR